MSSMRAIIPAAGVGTRMRPLTHSRPKVLLPVAGRPILGHLISDLAAAGIHEITLVVGHYGEMVEQYCRRSFPEVRFRFVWQHERLGLGHAIGEAISPDDEGLLVVLGDTLFSGDLGQFTGEEAAVGVVEVEDPRRFGVAVVEEDRIIHLEEKPQEPRSNLALIGIYYFPDAAAVKGAVQRLVREDRRTRGEYQITDAMQLMIEEGLPFRAVKMDEWFDCGVPEMLIETNRILLEGRPGLQNIPEEVRNGNVIVPPVAIGPGVKIVRSIIGPNVHIGSGCTIEESIIAESILDDECAVEGVRLRGAVLGVATTLRREPVMVMLGDHNQVASKSE